MKYLFLAMAAVGMVACADKEQTPQDGPQAVVGAEKGYIALNIKSADDITRAAGATYEDGTTAEQLVTGATFYFFDAAGNAFNINGAKSYHYVSATDNGTTAAPNIESMTDPVLVVEKYKGEFPSKVVAVVNYEGNANLSLNQLKSTLSSVGHTSGTNFIMTNSVYADAANKEIDATELTIDNFQTTAADAQSSPVTVYVERINAKLTLTAGSAAFDTGATVGSTAVYAQILGWDVIGNQTESYFVKSINPAWTDAELGFVWNDAPYFRSYWASTSVAAAVDGDVAYNDLVNGDATIEYLGEQVGARATYVVAAQLQDAEGNALEIAQWYGVNYVGEEALLAAVAPALKHKLMQFDGSSYTSIDDAQIICVAGMEGAESYEVKFQLAEGIATDNWFAYDGATATYTAVADPNAVLAALEPAKVWKSGMTYYYGYVKHLGAEGSVGEYGVIRNHSYKIAIQGVNGWGTPVYDPEAQVVPVKPTDKETYIAAAINVLSWRVVSENVTLN